VSITRPTTTILNIPNDESELRTYTVNFEIEQRLLDSETERLLYEDEKTIEFYIHNDSGSLTLEKCHLTGSKTVTMQQVLCEEVGGQYSEDYLCLFGDTQRPFMEYLCDIEQMVVAIEVAGYDPICSDNTTTCTTQPNMLFPGKDPKPTAQTTYCNTITQ
jgi:hypothetical protein